MTNSRERFVYFIRPIGADGPIKIGCTVQPERRLYGLMIWAPQPLEILATAPGGFSEEAAVHSRFADLHSHHEWFRYSPRLGEAIRRVAETGSLSHILEMPEIRPIRKKAKRKFDPDRRKYLSYSCRIRIACERVRERGYEAWDSPADVAGILYRWSGYGRNPRVTPTTAEFERLDEFLSDPVSHCVEPAHLRKEAA